MHIETTRTGRIFHRYATTITDEANDGTEITVTVVDRDPSKSVADAKKVHEAARDFANNGWSAA